MTEKGGCPGFEPQPGHHKAILWIAKPIPPLRMGEIPRDRRKGANKVLQ